MMPVNIFYSYISGIYNLHPYRFELNFGRSVFSESGSRIRLGLG
jgi:hypothetical protein